MIKIFCYEDEYSEGDTALLTLQFFANKKFDTNATNELTQRRSESGYTASDNSSILPKVISMSGEVGDVNVLTTTNFFNLYYTTPTQNTTYINQLITNMNRIRDEKLFCVLYNSRDGKYYKNYLIKSLSMSENSKTTKGFTYSMEFRQVIIDTIGTSSISTTTTSPYQEETSGQGSVDSVSSNTETTSIGASLYDRVFTN